MGERPTRRAFFGSQCVANERAQEKNGLKTTLKPSPGAGYRLSRDEIAPHGTAQHATPRSASALTQTRPPVPNLRPIHFGLAASGSGSKKPAKVELRRARSASSMRRAASRYWVVSPVDLRLRSASMSFASFS